MWAVGSEKSGIDCSKELSYESHLLCVVLAVGKAAFVSQLSRALLCIYDELLHVIFRRNRTCEKYQKKYVDC